MGQEFGGDWTEQKLSRLKNYLEAYTKIFRSNEAASHFAITYLDAFAGERRGTSLSGSFISLNELIEQAKNKKIDEVWSDYIVRYFLAPKGSIPNSLL